MKKKQQALQTIELCLDVPDTNVSNYESVIDGDATVRDAETLVTPLTKIAIHFDYPLKRPVTFDFKSDTGFTKGDLYRCIYEGYKKIYDTEGDAPTQEEAGVSSLINRVSTEGKYGIWGHYMGDLSIAWVEETKPGVFHLAIES